METPTEQLTFEDLAREVIALRRTQELLLAREVIALRRTQESLLEILAEIQAQIGPVVNSLKDSPILKMMGVK